MLCFLMEGKMPLDLFSDETTDKNKVREFADSVALNTT